jgi:hypothetical protein
MLEVAELKGKVPSVLWGLAGLVIVAALVFSPFLLATVPLLGLALVAISALPLKIALSKLFSPRWVGRIMILMAGYLLVPHAITWTQDRWHQVFPKGVEHEAVKTSKAEAQTPLAPSPAALFHPWYTSRKDCHLFSRQLQGDTGQVFAGRAACATNETLDLYCQCSDYQGTPQERNTWMDRQHTCSLWEETTTEGSVTRHERARFNRFDSAACRQLSGTLPKAVGLRYICSCQ